ncbi:LuxR family transcriptional regulator [Streptomyces sp. NRRL B-1568]|uniref:DNA-binding NarL/FixJ family response regulator n=1 Tax=Streptomyces olivoverticillatus TaxID=66427 RepID=A0A7W7LQM1_9ACTN|nr:response regulator transcription factor [Streptomyces olivoverticillatus]KJY43632.1 LuxR family transcriptional regulator [Streptomyces sp. NRRL B-1568]MBB4893936.1 DNA-binding NarL/FixJ family response regulator [Streptomyces olivoverticillatus]
MNASGSTAPDPDPPVTVLIVDDDELTRTGLRALLSAKPDLDVVGEAADGAEVLPLVERLRPDVVLMDVRMPSVDGIEATRRLRSALADPPKVIVITTFENDEHVYDALRAGASGFIRKRAPSQQIAHAIRLVATGDSLLFPDAVRRLAAARPVPRHAPTGRAAALTGREREILRLMAKGRSNQEAATQLQVSLETVKTHVGNVLTKLGASNRTQAVVLAYEEGLMGPWAADA